MRGRDLDAARGPKAAITTPSGPGGIWYWSTGCSEAGADDGPAPASPSRTRSSARAGAPFQKSVHVASVPVATQRTTTAQRFDPARRRLPAIWDFQGLTIVSCRNSMRPSSSRRDDNEIGFHYQGGLYAGAAQRVKHECARVRSGQPERDARRERRQGAAATSLRQGAFVDTSAARAIRCASMAFDFEKALRRWTSQHTDLVELKNSRVRDAGGVYERWENPVLTASHVPLFWRYDLDRRRNPFLLERHGLAAVGAAGAVERAGKICLVVRLVARDGGSFFAVAESDNGVDNFHFWDHPLRLPEGDAPDTGLSDMRLTAHEDGWLYGVFGASRGEADGEARFGIVRTHDLVQLGAARRPAAARPGAGERRPAPGAGAGPVCLPDAGTVHRRARRAGSAGDRVLRERRASRARQRRRTDRTGAAAERAGRAAAADGARLAEPGGREPRDARRGAVRLDRARL